MTPTTGANLSNVPSFIVRSDNPPSSAAPITVPFRAPAHKHAHHLHSIPPREKSTRTLIIDHMLWVHARTRFSQARAELGMTDRTGGKGSSNYAHRERPENYEESEEEPSDGEDISPLKAREGNTQEADDDARLANQDLILARSLRLRAEGLEKVVAAMLDQPPAVHPMHDQDYLDSPAESVNGRHAHTLPDGVRLGLALGTVINDLFARQAPVPRHCEKPLNETADIAELSDSVPRSQFIPRALSLLSAISGAPSGTDVLPAISGRSRHLPSLSSQYQTAFQNSAFSSGIPNIFPNPSLPPLEQQHWTEQSQEQPAPSLRTRNLYIDGADPSSANSPPQFRCPRHLHTGCEICVEAKTAVGNKQKGRSPENTRNISSSSTVGGGITGYQEGTGIGSGLAYPGISGSVLRRNLNIGKKQAGAGNTKLTELIPRFIRLSALVAQELGLEANEAAGIDTDANGTDTKKANFTNALLPSREWYMLLAGLLTRATLEGYLTAGWIGVEATECLMGVGLGCAQEEHSQNSHSGKAAEADLEDKFEEFDPDELPCLLEAAQMLFPALRNNGDFVKGSAEAEFEVEMDLRLRKFYDIPASTPDLATHMEDLAWQYPAEPIERAGLRFLEAVAKWRGKPELETYKKKLTPTISVETSPGGSTSVTMESLVHSNPESPETARTIVNPMNKPPIEKYFMPHPQLSPAAGLRRNKRPSSPSSSWQRPSKRTH